MKASTVENYLKAVEALVKARLTLGAYKLLKEDDTTTLTTQIIECQKILKKAQQHLQELKQLTQPHL